LAGGAGFWFQTRKRPFAGNSALQGTISASPFPFALSLAMDKFDLLTKALRIGAFSGLAVSLFAVITDSPWLLENKFVFAPWKEGSRVRLFFQFCFNFTVSSWINYVC
jgi:hypothetical protein